MINRDKNNPEHRPLNPELYSIDVKLIFMVKENTTPVRGWCF
jgi:hypothetical protein